MFSLSLRSLSLLGAAALAGCASAPPKHDAPGAPRVFYIITGEIALARHEPRTAALQYTAAAAADSDPALLERACQVTLETLQPSLTARVAARWIALDPNALEAHRAAGRAALELHQIEASAHQYELVLRASPRGVDAELPALASDLESVDDVFGARQVADRLAAAFPSSVPVRRLQGLSALRADDPASAVKSLRAALELTEHATSSTADVRREIIGSLWRARILAGDAAEPLAEAQALAEREATLANRLDYALLLIAAQRNASAIEELERLAREPEAAATALRLLGLLEYQDGRLDAATERFTELLSLGKSVDDAFYYLGLIAERRGDVERALRLYAQVQAGEDSVAALVRAGSLLESHGEAAKAEELLVHLTEDEPERAPQIIAARARLYTQAGNPKAALAVLEQATREYPDSVDLRYAIASTYDEEGQVAAALKELREILASRPDDPAALNALGYTLADHRRELKLARSLIERAYASAPKNAAIEDSLGWVLFRQGDTERALGFLTTAYADDRGADIGAHLGEVLWQLGRHADADKVWDDAAQSDPDNRLLRETRTRLHPAR